MKDQPLAKTVRKETWEDAERELLSYGIVSLDTQYPLTPSQAISVGKITAKIAERHFRIALEARLI